MKVSFVAALLGLALLAIYVRPGGSAPAPSPNCMLESMGVDTGSLETILNLILSICIELIYNHDDPCAKQSLIGELEGAMGDMMCMMDDMNPQAHQVMSGMMSPLLEALGQLLEGLLGSEGVLGALGGLLSDVVNLILCLLTSLGLKLDIGIALKIGNLLNLDLKALLNLLG